MPDFRTRLKTLRDGMLRLHKSLLELQRADYVRDVAPITTTGQYLNLVLDDPAFQWLRELSAFIVIIDEALAQKTPPMTEEDAERLISQARGLLSPAEEGTGFARSYFEIMQREAAAVLAHRDMLQVMNAHQGIILDRSDLLCASLRALRLRVESVFSAPLKASRP